MNAAAGWPRPYTSEGLPVPWAAVGPNHMGELDGYRHRREREECLCQVCGLELAGEVVLFIEGEFGSVGAPDLASVDFTSIDDAVLHPRCAKLAAKFCPSLKRRRERGELFAAFAPVAAIDFDNPEPPFDDEAPRHFITVRGIALSRIEHWQPASRKVAVDAETP